MKKIAIITTVFAIALMAIGCGRKVDLREVEVDVPKWFANPPSSDDVIYGIATARSRDMQVAMQKARQEATVDIAGKLEQRVMAMTKNFAQEVGEAGDANLYQMFEAVSKTVVNQTLNGVQVKEQSIKQNPEKLYVIYMLMEMPLGAANKALMHNLKAREELYTRLQASKSFRELREEIDRLEAEAK